MATKVVNFAEIIALSFNFVVAVLLSCLSLCPWLRSVMPLTKILLNGFHHPSDAVLRNLSCGCRKLFFGFSTSY